MLSNVPKKSAEVLTQVINSARRNGVQAGMREDHMFIKEIICGKGLLFKKMDIKGRSRMGIIRVPKSSIKVVLEEKPLIDYYKMMLKGDCPPQLAQLFKTAMVQSDADFKQIRSTSYMTTSQGRRYRKM